MREQEEKERNQSPGLKYNICYASAYWMNIY